MTAAFRRKRKRSCGGKRRYHDHDDAITALHRLASKSSRTKVPTRAYPCARCKGWHLTSRPDRYAT